MEPLYIPVGYGIDTVATYRMYGTVAQTRVSRPGGGNTYENDTADKFKRTGAAPTSVFLMASPSACKSPSCTLCAHCHNLLCSPPPRAPPPQSRLAQLPDDCLEAIAKGCGSDLGRFAAVSKQMRAVASPSSKVWKQVYESKYSVDLDDLDVLSNTLWRACLLREAPPKQM